MMTGSAACGPSAIAAAMDLTRKSSRSLDVAYRSAMYALLFFLSASKISGSRLSANLACDFLALTSHVEFRVPVPFYVEQSL